MESSKKIITKLLLEKKELEEKDPTLFQLAFHVCKLASSTSPISNTR